MRRVIVEPYNEDWVHKFNEEKNLLHHIFGEELVAIHHIGSTSVPRLSAKPIIDLMPVAKNIRNIDNYNEDMKDIGYEPMGEFGIKNRRYFRKGGEDRSHHIHVFQEGSPDVERHLAFRDYLRTHEDVAQQYGELKQKLAKQYPHDMEAYIDGKEQLVKDIEQEALSWYIK
ncbi:GrpB family protein [Pontibacillus sp. HMF3514]|uniref:GrpB family protein n=1 Tax=Pontibacillus sp. HMF3514 TaxID=2692425 RepID=UPI00131FC112|nr:GrpB family protein [Pontibacillus sp. HMF3514]QHE52681.1 GrpB family protein [Pontibacillus sp. HMF3514]